MAMDHYQTVSQSFDSSNSDASSSPDVASRRSNPTSEARKRNPSSRVYYFTPFPNGLRFLVFYCIRVSFLVLIAYLSAQFLNKLVYFFLILALFRFVILHVINMMKMKKKNGDENYFPRLSLDVKIFHFEVSYECLIRVFMAMIFFVEVVLFLSVLVASALLLGTFRYMFLSIADITDEDEDQDEDGRSDAGFDTHRSNIHAMIAYLVDKFVRYLIGVIVGIRFLAKKWERPESADEGFRYFEYGTLGGSSGQSSTEGSQREGLRSQNSEETPVLHELIIGRPSNSGAGADIGGRFPRNEFEPPSFRINLQFNDRVEHFSLPDDLFLQAINPDAIDSSLLDALFPPFIYNDQINISSTPFNEFQPVINPGQLPRHPEAGLPPQNSDDAITSNPHPSFNNQHGPNIEGTSNYAEYPDTSVGDSVVMLTVNSFKVPKLRVEIPKNENIGYVKKAICSKVITLFDEGNGINILHRGRIVGHNDRVSPNVKLDVDFVHNHSLISITEHRMNEPLDRGEVETLIAGVQKFGTGSWKQIQEDNKEILGKYSSKKLQDKWKSLLKTAKRPAVKRRGLVIEQELLDQVLALDDRSKRRRLGG